MPMFVHLQVDPVAAADTELAQKLVEVSPVTIFEQDGDGTCVVVRANEAQLSRCGL